MGQVGSFAAKGANSDITSLTGLTTALTVGQGGTGLAAGTSGGVPYFNATSTMASSALLGLNDLMLGGGAGAAPKTIVSAAAGQILTSGGLNTSPAWIASLPITNGGTGATSLGAAQSALGISLTGATSGSAMKVGTGGVTASKLCASESSGGGVACNDLTSSFIASSVSDETGSGVLVFGTAPTFTTSITAPLIIGGSGTTQSLIYKTTTGVGAAGADHIFQVGNNGATEAMRILNSGSVGIGVAAPAYKLDVAGDVNISGNFKVNGVNISAGGGTVTSVTATAPVVSSGGNTPAISMAAATTSVPGYLTAADWNTFNGKAPLASPTFTGVPLAPTAAANTNTTQIATTAFVMGQVGSFAAKGANSDITSLTGLTTMLPLNQGGTGANLTAANGGIIYSTGSAMAVSAAGTSGNFLKSSGAASPAWASIGLTDLKSTVAGNVFPATACSAGQTLQYVVLTDSFTCTNIVVTTNANLTGPITSSGNTTSVASQTGTGSKFVMDTAPTISNPIITNIAPAADFSLTQNTVIPFKSVNSGAIVNTLVLNAGSVGIGNASPRTALDVSGAIVSKAPADINSSTAVNFASNNLQYTSTSCGAFALSNMVSGGTYTLAVQGGAATACSFTASGFTVHTGSATLTPTATKHIIFTFLVMGTHVYVASVDGF